MFKGRCVFSIKMLLRFYLAYVVSIISYGLLICGITSKINLEKIYLFQKTKFKHFSSKFIELGLETVNEIYLNQLFKETIFQYLKRSPLDYLIINKFSNRRSRRSTSNGMIPFYRCKTKMMKNSLFYKIVKCFK